MDSVLNNPIIISAFGFPCLDYIVKITNSDLLDKYNFPYNGQIDIDSITFFALLDDIKKGNYEIVKCAGGCAQNTLRLFQWLIGVPYKTLSFGTVGKDNEMHTMKEQVENDGVLTRYAEMENCRTSCIIILPMKNTRCCIGNESNRLICPPDYPDERYQNIAVNSVVLHIDGFFAVHHPKNAHKLISLSGKRVVSFNLGSVHLITLNPYVIFSIAKTCDVLFSNKEEFQSLVELNNLAQNTFVDSIKHFYQIMLSATPKDNSPSFMKKLKKILVITDGANNIHCIFGDSELIIYDAIYIEDDMIVDTTGAGDAFIAGFIYGLVQEFDIRNCLHIACKTAVEIVRHPGVVIPNENPLNIIG